MNSRSTALGHLAVRTALALHLVSLAAGVRAASVDLDVTLDPAARLLWGTATLQFADSEARAFRLASAATIERITVRGRPVQLEAAMAKGQSVFRLPANVQGREVLVVYRLPLAPLDAARDHRAVLHDLPPMADERGSFLPASSGWYPQPTGDFTYSVAVSVPESQRAVVPGRLASESASNGAYRARFEFPYPSDGIDLMAGPYTIRERHAAVGGRDLRLRTYFGPDLPDAISEDYLVAVERYLRMYSERIGEYPFDGFSVVASPLPTGLGMPTLTYLGAQVIRLPFIRDTSLGHEVLHSWWGNAVYPDYAQGNWAEGLTTFMADYAYKEQADASSARDMRQGWLRDYAALPADADRPLNAFTSRTHSASAAVGYGKAAMVFYMAREKIGPDSFDRALRAFYREYRFRRATWNDLDAALVKASGQRSGPVLEPWLNRPGVAQVAISTAVAERSGSDWDLYVLFVQDTPPYPLDVPIAVRTASGERKLRVAVTSARDAATITLQDKPLAVALDPDFQLWRALAPGESPPIVREAIAAREPALVVLDKQRDFATAAETLCSALLERPPRRVDALGAEGTVAIVAGTPERVDAALAKYQLGARPGIGSDRSTAQVWTVRRGQRTVLVISARDPASLAALARALPHLGGQSWAVFEGPRPVARGTWPAETTYVPVRLVGKP